MTKIQIVKRNGKREDVKFDSITKRNERLAKGLDIDVVTLSQAVIAGLRDGIHTDEIDTLSCETAMSKSVFNPDYEILAKRIYTSNLHKKTSDSFAEVCEQLMGNINIKTGKSNPLLNKDYMEFAKLHEARIQKALDYSKDYDFQYFGLKTLESAYLLKIGGASGRIVERPQHMFMRVSLGIHGPIADKSIEGNIDLAIETYHELSKHKFIHATPTLFNSGSNVQQNSSCFLTNIDDSIDKIFEAFHTCARISKQSGGIGCSLKVRGKGSYINGTNGRSGGIIPMLKVLNEVARYVDQCFTGDTKVFTSTGPKAIKCLTVGDKVLTHDGSYQCIESVKADYLENQELYKIGLDCCHPGLDNWTTEMHPFMSIKTNLQNKDYIKEKLRVGMIIPEYTEMEQLTVGDYIGFSMPVSPDCSTIKISEEDAYFEGLFNSAGKFDSQSGKVRIRYFNVTVRKFIEDYLNKKCVQHEIELEGMHVNYKQSHFVSLPQTCQIPESVLLQYPMKHSQSYVMGFLDGLDLCDQQRQAYTLDTIPETKRSSFFYLLLKIGVLPTVIDGVLQLPSDIDKARLDQLYHNNVIYSRIEKFIYKEKWSGLLYDLNVANNQNYVTEFGLCHNGGGKRLGRFAVYLQPSHPDIMDFLEIRLNSGLEEFRARDIFPALWLPDLYFDRLKKDEVWSLFDPSVVPELLDAYGEEYEKIYKQAETEGRIEIRYLSKVGHLEKCQATLIGHTEKEADEFICKLHGTDKLHFTKDAPVIIKSQYKLAVKACNAAGNEYNSSFTIDVDLSDLRSHRTVSDEHCEVEVAIHPKYTKQIRARELWQKAMLSICETGLPYMANKDAVNNKNMQKNIGVIRGSNLCLEVVEYHDSDSVAVCNLASLALPKFVKDGKFSFAEMRKIIRIAIRNLNNVIDRNWYPVESAKTNNQNHRPIGLGVQGLADVFAIMQLTWDSAEAQLLNKLIFETIYYTAIETSIDLASQHGTYSTYKGSPYSEGKLHYDLWNTVPITLDQKEFPSLSNEDLKLDWNKLKKSMAKHGVRNSLHIALMPTVSTSQILGNSESFEPYTSNIFVKNGTVGEVIVVNQHLYKMLKAENLWTPEIVKHILHNEGSIAKVDGVSQKTKDIYKTVWELSQKLVVQMAADRAPWVDQTMSMNLHFTNPTIAKLSSMYSFGQSKGLKTLSYYVRSKAAKEAVRFGLGSKTLEKTSEKTSPSSTSVQPELEICLACQ